MRPPANGGPPNAAASARNAPACSPEQRHHVGAAVTRTWRRRPTGSAVLRVSTRQQMAQSPSRLPIVCCRLRVPRAGSPSSTSAPTAFRSPHRSPSPALCRTPAARGKRSGSGTGDDQLSSVEPFPHTIGIREARLRPSQTCNPTAAQAPRAAISRLDARRSMLDTRHSSGVPTAASPRRRHSSPHMAPSVGRSSALALALPPSAARPAVQARGVAFLEIVQ